MKIGNNPQVNTTPNTIDPPKKKKADNSFPIKIDLSSLKGLDSWEVSSRMSDMVEDLGDDARKALYGKVESAPEGDLNVGLIYQGKGWEGGSRDIGLQGTYNLKTKVHSVKSLAYGPEAVFSSVAVLGRIGSNEIAVGGQYRLGMEMKQLNRLEEMLTPNDQASIGIAGVATAAAGVHYDTGAFVETALGAEVTMKFPNTKMSFYMMPEVVGRVGGHNDVFGRVQMGVKIPLK